MRHKRWLSAAMAGNPSVAPSSGGVPAHPAAPPGHSAPVEVGLRLMGAALQILSTWALVGALTPEGAGVYFRGFVISLGAAAFIRGNYELYIAHHLIGGRASVTGIADGVVLFQLSRRVLLRASLICGALLVVTADLDIQAPRLQPVLETYLPFVLAIPGVSLSTLIGEALRAANRTLLGTVIAAYATNISILLTVAFAPANAPLALYAWAFLGGSLVAAAVAVVLGRRAFPAKAEWCTRPIGRELLQQADQRGLITLARGVLLWGPLCILATIAPAVQMANYAVAARTAMVVDFFLPALNLSGGRDVIRQTTLSPDSAYLLRAQLGRSLLYSSVFVAALLSVGHATLMLYGHPYDTEWSVYAVLLGVQWINSVGRPAIRHVVREWDAMRIQAWVSSGAVATLGLSCVAVSRYGALGVAVAAAVGAVIVNGRAIAAAFSRD